MLAQFQVDGRPAPQDLRVTARSHLRLALTAAVPSDAVRVTMDGAVAPNALAWALDGASADVVLSGVAPYRTVQFGLRTASPVHNPGQLQVTMVPTLPANTSSGIGPGFEAQTPLQLVVENSGPARPQAGLQDADVVYEYLSEYQTTRMTAIYFNHVPDLVGPLRSCRMINPYLVYAFSGLVMCTGVSNGTAHYLYGDGSDARPVPNLVEPTDTGGHFFRVDYRAIPHNAYTSGPRAESLRGSAPPFASTYAVDPPHDDANAGQPADAPGVPLHSVAYTYDGGSRQYLRSDHGTAFTDQVTGAQVHAKTVVLLHVPFHDAGWIEDENGGAHSIWYDMLGSGPAEVYANGLVVHATWHMGAGGGQPYYDNHQPVWFTDESGRQLLLDTGLTWIHVLGDGQTS